MLGQSDDLPSIKPKVGAECLNWARSDLCGGRPVMGVPTAFLRPYRSFRFVRSLSQRVRSKSCDSIKDAEDGSILTISLYFC
jgi:hypothetical protein